MTDPISPPPSFISGLESYYNSWQDLIAEKVLNGAVKISALGGPLTENVTKAAICSYHPLDCAMETLKYGAYELPKAALESTASLAFWGTKQVSGMVFKYLPNLASAEATSQQTNQSALAKIYELAAQQTEKLSLHSTSWITGKSVQQLTAELAQQNSIDPNLSLSEGPAFKAIDLIGPSLLLYFFTQKALNNLSDAAYHAKLLVTGKRRLFTSYTTSAADHRTEDNCEIKVSKTRFYTTPRLAWYVAMETTFSGIWGFGAYISYHAIHDAVEVASNSSEQASLVANTLLITSVVAPTVFNWLKEALNPPHEASNLTSPIVPNFSYTSPQRLMRSSIEKSLTFDQQQKVGIYPLTELNSSSETLSPEEALKRLKEYRENKPEESE